MKATAFSSGLILVNIFLLVASAPTYDNNDVIQQNEYHINPDGTFQYSIVENDYTKLVKGIIKNFGGEDILFLEGSYSYTTPDLFNVSVEFTTGENGSIITKTSLRKIASGPPTYTPPTQPVVPIVTSINPKAIGSILG